MLEKIKDMWLGKKCPVCGRRGTMTASGWVYALGGEKLTKMVCLVCSYSMTVEKNGERAK